MIIINATDALAPFFSGDKQWDEAVADACELSLKTFKNEIFICESCEKVISPEVITNENGVFIKSNRVEVRGGKGNYCIKKNICEECVKKMGVV